MFKSGMIVPLILFLGTFLFNFYYTRIAKEKKVYVRNVPALDAIEEGIGRCSEMGKPCLFTTGGSGSVGTSVLTAQVIASMSVLRFVASLTAEKEVELIVPVKHSSTLPVQYEIVETSYEKEGKIEQFRPDNIIWWADAGWTYAAATAGILYREEPGTSIFVGPASTDMLFIQGPAASSGKTLTITGSGRFYSSPFAVVASDYAIFGDEVMAAGAYLSQEPEQLGSLRGQDMMKFIANVLLLLGVILASAGTMFLKDVLSM